jgi:excisionase family DNA binding protein
MSFEKNADVLLTPAEAAERLRVSEFTLLDWLRAGIVPGVKIGGGKIGRWRVRLSDIEGSLRQAHQLPRLTADELDRTVQSIHDVLLEGDVFAGPESLKPIVHGIEHPSELFWRDLARGVRALQAGSRRTVRGTSEKNENAID